MLSTMKVAVICSAPVGVGGLGMQAFNAIEALSEKNVEVHVFCTEPARSTSLTGVTIHRAPFALAPWRSRYTWLRWLTGRFVYLNDHRLGLWASYQMDELKPNVCYLFTQVALETLLWAQQAGVPCVLDSPNGHIRNFRKIYLRESERWCSRSYTGHPTSKMVDRVEREYKLAQRIRVFRMVKALYDRGRCIWREDYCDWSTNRSQPLQSRVAKAVCGGSSANMFCR